MPNVREPLKVVKVPLSYKPDFKITKFPPMPRLYLELLENKQKVKPELRNREYIPKILDNLPSVQYASSVIDNEDKDEDDFINDRNETPRADNSGKFNNKSFSYKDSGSLKNKTLDLSNDSPRESYKELSLDKKSKYNDLFSKYKDSDSRDFDKKYNSDSDGDRSKKYQDKDDYYKDSYKDSYKDGNWAKPSDRRETNSRGLDSSNKELSNDKKSSNNEENELINILKTGSTFVASKGFESMTNSSSNQIVKDNIPTSSNNLSLNNGTNNQQIPNIPKQPSNLPPSLQEIGEGKVPPSTGTGNYYEVNVSRNDQTELSRKREILHKFKYLRKYYPEVSIPEYNEYTDIQTLENEYNSLVKTLRIDSNVENYKKYLQMGFFGLEFFLSTVLKFEDIKGFSTAQALNMNQYEKILVEIGEKSYIPEDKQIAPEFRLLGIILMNAAVFIGSKMMMKRMGLGGNSSNNQPKSQPSQQQQNPASGFTNMFSSMFSGMSGGMNPPASQRDMSSQPKTNNGQQPQPEFVKKKTMKGPDMSEFDEIINKKNV